MDQQLVSKQCVHSVYNLLGSSPPHDSSTNCIVVEDFVSFFNIICWIVYESQVHWIHLLLAPIGVTLLWCISAISTIAYSYDVDVVHSWIVHCCCRMVLWNYDVVTMMLWCCDTKKDNDVNRWKTYVMVKRRKMMMLWSEIVKDGFKDKC